MNIDPILSLFSVDVGIAVTGRQIHFCKNNDPDTVISLDAVTVPDSPDLPSARLPDEVRDGLTTKRHLEVSGREVPIICRGLVQDCDAIQSIIKQGMDQLCSKIGPVRIKPRAVLAAMFNESCVLKAGWLKFMESAGARRRYIVEYVMACAIGLGLDVLSSKVRGVLAMESDWSEFAAVSYAETLVKLTIPYGVDDLVNDVAWELDARSIYYESLDSIRSMLSGSELTEEIEFAANLSLRRLANPILKTLDDTLRDKQYQKLKRQPMVICGEGASLGALQYLLPPTLGLAVQHKQSEIHPALNGAYTYLQHLEEWKGTLQTD